MFRQCRTLMIWMTAFMLCAQTVCPASLSTCCCRTNSETDQTELGCCQAGSAQPVQKACCNPTARQTENVSGEFHTAGCSCGQNELPALPGQSRHIQETLLQDLNLQLASFVDFSQAAEPSCQFYDVAVSSHHSQKYAQVLFCVALI
ncbi:hypothetical protein Pan161_43340 [Gimesia algae]|uniref:Uncharacterized protein n=1 Tax=Gimesia algae TaxID=2527971 RepID=A0A517VI22_9PLAN|nr:hypothetical protein Pan161_43340 [Gimesia algae]